MKTVEDRLEEALDAALEMTFPASDPIAVYVADTRNRADKLPPEEARTAQPRI